jgi:hypothetical protein
VRSITLSTISPLDAVRAQGLLPLLLPFFQYISFVYLSTRGELTDTLPKRFQNAANVLLVIFIPAIVALNELSSFIGIFHGASAVYTHPCILMPFETRRPSPTTRRSTPVFHIQCAPSGLPASVPSAHSPLLLKHSKSTLFLRASTSTPLLRAHFQELCQDLSLAQLLGNTSVLLPDVFSFRQARCVVPPPNLPG